jgi:ankyrin repeat protein
MNTQNSSLVKFLEENGFTSINDRTYNNKTPLHIALEEKQFAIVKLLLSKNDININAQDQLGNTPLHIALRCYRDAALKSYYREEIYVSGKIYDKPNPKLVAQYEEVKGIVNLILEKEPNVNLYCKYNFKALNLIIGIYYDDSKEIQYEDKAKYLENDLNFARSLIELGAEPAKYFRYAVWQGNFEITKLLLEYTNLSKMPFIDDYSIPKTSGFQIITKLHHKLTSVKSKLFPGAFLTAEEFNNHKDLVIHALKGELSLNNFSNFIQFTINNLKKAYPDLSIVKLALEANHGNVENTLKVLEYTWGFGMIKSSLDKALGKTPNDEPWLGNRTKLTQFIDKDKVLEKKDFVEFYLKYVLRNDADDTCKQKAQKYLNELSPNLAKLALNCLLDNINNKVEAAEIIYKLAEKMSKQEKVFPLVDLKNIIHDIEFIISSDQELAKKDLMGVLEDLASND